MRKRLLASAFIVLTLALSHGATTFAAASRVQTSFTLVDAGSFVFQSQSSAALSGDGFEKQGFGLNRHVGSNGQFDVVPGADRCANGLTGVLVGSAVESNGDRINYTINNELCPTEVPGIFSASGTYKITGGTGKYAAAKGGGLFEGLADFNPGSLKYKCLLFGTITY